MGRPTADSHLAAVLAHAAGTYHELWPGGTFRGDEYVVRSPLRDESKAGSFSINNSTGLWHDKATDEAGNLLQLIAESHCGGDDKAARRFIADFVRDHNLLTTRPAAPAAATPREDTRPEAAPIEDGIQPPEADSDGNAVVASWAYRSSEGELLFWVVRSETPQGKQTVPVHLQGSAYRWGLPRLSNGVPLYQGHLLRPSGLTVYGEGEKVAQHLQSIVPAGWVAVTNQGGAGAFAKADRSVLAKQSKLIMFPDNDEPGTALACEVAAYCLLMTAAEVHVVDLAALEWADKEDAADHTHLQWGDYEKHFTLGDEYLNRQPGRVRIQAVLSVLRGLDSMDRLAVRKAASKLADIPVGELDRLVMAAPPGGKVEVVEPEPTPEERAELREQLWPTVAHIAEQPDVLDAALKVLQTIGHVGEEMSLQALLLSAWSRHVRKASDRPASAIIKGESASGKSFSPKGVLRMFHEDDAFYQLSTLSEKALFYSSREWKGRIIFIPEANQLQADESSVLLSVLRQLVTDGRIAHEVTVKDPDTGEMSTRLVEKEGPVTLWVGTTRDVLDHELETRCLSILTDESPEQTRRIADADAQRRGGGDRSIDDDEVESLVAPWREFDVWLGLLDTHGAVIPFAAEVVRQVELAPVRFRRDWPQLWGLVRTHALVHWATREKDDRGRVIATHADYQAVRQLLEPIMAMTAGLKSNARHDTVSTWVYGQMPQRVRDGKGTFEISTRDIAKGLQMPQQTAAFRMKRLIEAGQFVNIEAVRGRPYRLKLGKTFTPPGESERLLPSLGDTASK